MEFISLILCFTVVFFEFVNKVIRPVHFHPLHALSCEVYYESSDLCQLVLSDDLASYKMTN